MYEELIEFLRNDGSGVLGKAKLLILNKTIKNRIILKMYLFLYRCIYFITL